MSLPFQGGILPTPAPRSRERTIEGVYKLGWFNSNIRLHFVLRDLRRGPQLILAPSLVAATRHSTMPTRNSGSTPGSCTKQPTSVEYRRECRRCASRAFRAALSWSVGPAWSGRHPVTVETMGSNPIRIAKGIVHAGRTPRASVEHGRRLVPTDDRVEKLVRLQSPAIAQTA